MELQAEDVVIEGGADLVVEESAPEPVSEFAGERLVSILESVLFAAGAPVTIKRLIEILGGPRRGPSKDEVAAAMARLAEEYAPGQRGIQLVEVSGGYQLRTARENAEWVRAIFRERPSRLGRAAMETLAIIAYRQPATRAEIEAVRGVDADAAINTLLSRRLVKIAGRMEAIGRPLLYATTAEFLETFGLKDLAELPSLRELGPVLDEEAIQRAAQAAPADQTVAQNVEPGTAIADHDEEDDEVRRGTSSENSSPGRDSIAARGRDADF